VDAEALVETVGAERLEFAIEAHLRDFLARNLEVIEPGLRLYATSVRSGVEFSVDNGRIDILAVDKQDKYVVVELKLSRGRNKALGQLLYYMSWVDKHLHNGPCRGLIVANEITEDLVMAISRTPGVKVARYRMSFSIDWLANEDGG
jgi:RecB family endonuclease NucS